MRTEKAGFLGKPFKNCIFWYGIEIPLVFIEFSNFSEFSYISHRILRERFFSHTFLIVGVIKSHVPPRKHAVGTIYYIYSLSIVYPPALKVTLLHDRFPKNIVYL